METDRIAVVVEDDPDVREVLESILIEAGFLVHAASTGAHGIELVREFNPSLITLDVTLPGIDGFETLRRIRLLTERSIIMISAHFDEIDVVQGLRAGADDFVAKPFRSGELRARIDAVLRRNTPAAAPAGTPEPVVAVTPLADAALSAQGWVARAGLRLNRERRLVEVDHEPVDLTRSEFDLLATLFQSADRVHTKAELVLKLRGGRYAMSGLVTDADKRSLEVHVANVRRKIGRNAAGTDRVETVRGVGYRLRAAAA
ncbi:MAG: response regulator transcription factor [Cryobacterium sp.]